MTLELKLPSLGIHVWPYTSACSFQQLSTQWTIVNLLTTGFRERLIGGVLPLYQPHLPSIQDISYQRLADSARRI